MRIGPEKKIEKEESPQLYEFNNNTGHGLFGIDGHFELPQECLQYVLSTYEYFKMPMFTQTKDIASIAAWMTYLYLDHYDPYHLLHGCCDVEYTDDWANYAYEILDNGRPIEEVMDVEMLETFRVTAPGTCERHYADCIRLGEKFIERQKAGISGRTETLLNSLPGNIGCDIEMMIDGEYMGMTALEHIEDHIVLKAFEELCGHDRRRMLEYFEIGAWAAYLWMSGPPGRQWRVEDHPIFYEAMTNPSGEAILYEGTILNKDSFRRLPRAFQSCVCCGLDGWCVEMVQIEGMTRSICEKCLNGNAPMYEGSTCGTKVCRYITCPHHPNKDDRAALHDIYRERGALLGYNKAASLLTQKCDKLLQLN